MVVAAAVVVADERGRRGMAERDGARPRRSRNPLSARSVLGDGRRAASPRPADRPAARRCCRRRSCNRWPWRSRPKPNRWRVPCRRSSSGSTGRSGWPSSRFVAPLQVDLEHVLLAVRRGRRVAFDHVGTCPRRRTPRRRSCPPWTRGPPGSPAGRRTRVTGGRWPDRCPACGSRSTHSTWPGRDWPAATG